ncbi:NAD+ synthase (glutamine-hydrolysing) [Oscillibacter sp. PC13]|uniref:NAD(+) synthase n=1 Tax=Oscillibacter sp. PC13 TaxID=1855299 RepID=UPI0008E7CE30|nr:NAD(+) synthase [Oscillibacter sp. PC13]SFP76747.1 NAD+ synthase (glutamine-hydrolysing) [Oscillibacter sp. PC13]
MKDGFISVACGSPKLRLADCDYNAEQTFTMMRQAEKAGVKVLVLPELGLTGYTCGDLFYQDTLLRGAEQALATVLEATRNLEVVTAVGLPVRYDGKLYNCAAIIQKGIILGVVPKTHLPNYGEFYEKRQFAPAPEARGRYLSLCGQKDEVLFQSGQIFRCENIPELTLGFEICEDLWTPDSPSVQMAQAGATIIGNLSASNDLIGKDAYRRQLVTMQSAKLLCGYVYSSAGEGESTSDMVFGAHQLIAENGALLGEKRFENGLLISEIDVQKLCYERRRTQVMEPASAPGGIGFSLTVSPTKITRYVAPMPFVPEGKEDRDARCREILLIASLGLKQRLEHTGAKTAVIGLSGGLDSTLAVLITGLAMNMLDRPMTDIVAVTMPCFGTTDRTRNNAVILAEKLGATLRTVDISSSVRSHFKDIGHDMADHSVTFENGQARERTQVLMDIANQSGGIVIGTGDLSELALGWCTYNGDHMSMYGVNASIPKTLVRHLVGYLARDNAESDEALHDVLEDILDTPVSPELLPAVKGEISQRTEDLVGPYELHDFFLYYVLRWGFSPRKVYRLAQYALGKQYSREVILKWLKTFYRRFFSQQFKRSCLPDGPKVGSVALSPRGDWRMPSDAKMNLWQSELDALE